jgi:hypothetical protein
LYESFNVAGTESWTRLKFEDVFIVDDFFWQKCDFDRIFSKISLRVWCSKKPHPKGRGFFKKDGEEKKKVEMRRLSTSARRAERRAQRTGKLLEKAEKRREARGESYGCNKLLGNLVEKCISRNR